jgi:hypothetical protein
MLVCENHGNRIRLSVKVGPLIWLNSELIVCNSNELAPYLWGDRKILVDCHILFVHIEGQGVLCSDVKKYLLISQLAFNEVWSSIRDCHLELEILLGHLLLPILKIAGDVIVPNLSVIHRMQIELKILITGLSTHYCWGDKCGLNRSSRDNSSQA